MKILSILVLLLSCCCFGRLYAQQPAPGLQSIMKAEALKKTRNYQAALVEYENAIKAEPNNHEYWLRKAKIYLLVKDIKNAMKSLEKVVSLKEDMVEVYFLLFQLHAKEKNLEGAIKNLDLAFKHEKDPKNKVGYKGRIIKLLYSTGQFKSAGTHIKELVGVAPQNPTVLYFDAKYSNLVGEYDNAVTSINNALLAVPTDEPQKLAKFYYELGYAQHKLGQYTQADAALEKANHGPFKAKIFELSPKYYVALATAYFSIFEIEKSEEFVDIALLIKKDFSQAHELKVAIAATKSDRTPRIESLKASSVSEKDPEKKAKKLEDLSQMEFEAGKYKDAIVSGKSSLELNPNNLPILFNIALCEYKQGNHKVAIDLLEGLANRPSISQDIRAKLNFTEAIIYEKMSNSKLAITSLKKSMFGNYKFAAIEKMKTLEK
ncbi:MAG: hypothetical protein EAZ97_01655 [Bacteroidetes bacterium]|nr:MAG: hypothetical protein EAZ97_01655 [Bacteroidota bacterium]